MMLIALDKIILIKAVEKLVYKDIVWKEERRWLFNLFPSKQAGFYSIWEDFNYGSGVWSKERIEKHDLDLYIEGHEVFHKPHIKIVLVNDQIKTRYFETKDELDAFVRYIRLPKHFGSFIDFDF